MIRMIRYISNPKNHPGQARGYMYGHMTHKKITPA